MGEPLVSAPQTQLLLGAKWARFPKLLIIASLLNTHSPVGSRIALRPVGQCHLAGYGADPILDIYLIRPPPEADHSPINPGNIVIAGDSAGGGMSLALLQVIRDAGLPMPAGGILISPWCDMTHSFPSVHTNTDTVCKMFCDYESTHRYCLH